MRPLAMDLLVSRISHSEYKTITLEGWHRVLLNTEPRARAMLQVAFLE